jgi:prephenate dehydratase
MKSESIAVLGPVGTYSSEAARQYDPRAKQLLCGTITQALEMVDEQTCPRAMVPYENSIQGIVSETLDGLLEHRLVAEQEVILDIHHNLYGLRGQVDPKDVETIYSHPQALAQCRKYLQKHYPGATLAPLQSTTAGMQHVLEQQDAHGLAIGPPFAAKNYDLALVDEYIEDEKHNQTRFLVCAKHPGVSDELGFVLVAIVPKADRPGLLRDILGVTAESGINLSQIESRPQRTHLGSYLFYLRLDMAATDGRFDVLVDAMHQLGADAVRLSA